MWEQATCIPNEFIDTYMTTANGEYVKIYLYLMRHLNHPETDLSIGAIADHFDCTEKDVTRALAYWEKLNLISLEHADVKPAKKSPSQDALKSLCQREDVRELVFLAETYLGRTMSHTDLEYIFCWYDQLQFPPELIEFLMEYTITRGHSSFHYMHKVAEDWHKQGIRTLDAAKQNANLNNEIYYTVLKSFGIRGRNLIPSEMDLLKKWSTTYGFDKEMIAEACKRTIQNIHEPRFEYADSILTSWHTAKLHNLEDVKQADQAYVAKQSATRSKTTTKPPQPNKFNNFEQRNYDYDQLTQQLLAKSIL